ncbi:hypothetical protein S83_013663 [Arachis hypogaea]
MCYVSNGKIDYQNSVQSRELLNSLSEDVIKWIGWNISLTQNDPVSHDLRDAQDGLESESVSHIRDRWQVNRNLNLYVFMQKFSCSINHRYMGNYTFDDTNAF